MKGIFDTRRGTAYDNDVTRHYNFPETYLSEAKKIEGDWIIYRSTRRGGSPFGYFAVARIESIKPDQSRNGYHYAIVSDYLEFDRVVPLKSTAGYYEDKLNMVPNDQVGRTLQGKSIRTIAEEEFVHIVLAGFAETIDSNNPHKLEYGDTKADRLLKSFIEDAPEERRIGQILLNRPLRDRAFRRSVVTAYHETCAVTGLRIVNGGGRAEVQAAHIKAVSDGGPDIVQNGIALSATCHWLFDRHLISIGEDYELLIAHNRVPTEYQNLFSKQLERIHLPSEKGKWPRSDFMDWHRNKFGRS